MHGLLVAIEAADMSETPLLHMTHSLSLLPPAPLLDPASLLVVRYDSCSCLGSTVIVCMQVHHVEAGHTPRPPESCCYDLPPHYSCKPL